MSELKARTARSIADEEEMLELGADCPIEPAQVYLKSEADKVIAELEKRIADGDKDFEMADHQNERLLKIVRHHKYKRCLDMAARCRLRGRLFGACGLYEKELWALKWHKRWLELADKFKEVKL